jgi:integral membrane sensor domain MASE1
MLAGHMMRRLLDNVKGRVTDRRYLLTAAILVIGYVLAARLGLSLSYTTEQVTTVWPPSGIALVALLVLGRRYWPAIFAGALVANSLAHETAWVALGIAVGDTLEAVAGEYLLRRVLGFKNAFRVPRDVGLYALAAALSTVIAALMGPAWLALGGNIEWSQYWHIAMLWWQGDLLGDLVFGPFLLAYLNRRSLSILRGRRIEAGLMLAVTFAVSGIIFTTHDVRAISFPYMMFPLVMWAAVRFTQLGAVSSTLLIAVTSIWATTGGVGPFGRGEVEAALVELQIYLAVLSATALFMAMAITERLAAEEALLRQATKLELLDAELKEANRRVTRILAGVLDGSGSKRGNDER